MRRFWKSPLEELTLPPEPQLEAYIALWNLRALSDDPAEERYEHVRELPTLRRLESSAFVRASSVIGPARQAHLQLSAACLCRGPAASRPPRRVVMVKSLLTSLNNWPCRRGTMRPRWHGQRAPSTWHACRWWCTQIWRARSRYKLLVLLRS